MRPSDYNTHQSCYTRTPSKSTTLNNKRKDAINSRRDKRRPAPKMYIVTARVVTLRMQNKIQFGFQRPKNHTHLQKTALWDKWKPFHLYSECRNSFIPSTLKIFGYNYFLAEEKQGKDI